MFHIKDRANEFLHYLNSCHSNDKFTLEFEQNNAIPLLDILAHVIKRTHEIHLPKENFHRSLYKKGLDFIRALTCRYYRRCSSGSLLQSSPRLSHVLKLLLQNGKPQGVIYYQINDVLNKNRHQYDNPVSTVPKKDIALAGEFL